MSYLLNKFLLIFLFLLAILFLCFFDWSLISNRIVSYPVNCIDGFYRPEDGICSSGKEMLLNTSSYVTDKKNQIVTMWGNGRGGTKIAKKTVNGCTIIDSRNWECKYGDVYICGFRNGIFYLPNTVDTRFVNKLEYYRLYLFGTDR